MSLARLNAEAERRGLLDSAARSESWDALLDRIRARTRAEAVPEQLAFIEDLSQWTLAFCGRQCGKGWAVLRLMLEVAMGTPGSVVSYVRRTRQLAEETMWSEPRDGILATLPRLGLVEGEHYTINLSKLRVTLANGSEIRCEGIERCLGWADVRGKKYALIVLDEMQEQEDAGLRQALDADIPATFMMYGGRFVGIGTPGQVSAGRFHDICEAVVDPDTGVPRSAGWSVHRWRSYHLRDRTPVWANLLAWKERHRIPDSNPRWRREGLGEWCADDSDLMLAVPDGCLWDIPEGMDWRQALPDSVPSRVPTILVPRRQGPDVFAGLDFGFRPSPCGIVVGSVSLEEGVLREVHSDKRLGLEFQQITDWVRAAVVRFGILRVYADWEDPRLIDMLQREGLPVVRCDKSDYDGKLSQMRGALLEGRLQVLRDSPLREELRSLAPDPKLLLQGQTRPKPGQEDHCFDALRYLFNGAWGQYMEAPEPPMTPDQARQREVEDIQRRRTEEARMNQAGGRGFDPRRRTR